MKNKVITSTIMAIMLFSPAVVLADEVRQNAPDPEFKNLLLQAQEEVQQVKKFNQLARFEHKARNQHCVRVQVEAENLAGLAAGAFFRQQFYSWGSASHIKEGTELARQSIELSRTCDAAESWKNFYVRNKVPGHFESHRDSGLGDMPAWRSTQISINNSKE